MTWSPGKSEVNLWRNCRLLGFDHALAAAASWNKALSSIWKVYLEMAEIKTTLGTSFVGYHRAPLSCYFTHPKDTSRSPFPSRFWGGGGVSDP